MAVAAARNALDQGASGRLTATERGRVLTKIGETLLDQLDELKQIESRDTGKPLATARYFKFYRAAPDKVHGEVIPFLNGHPVSLLRGLGGSYFSRSIN